MKTRLQFLLNTFLLTVKYCGGFLVWMSVLPCSFFVVQCSFQCKRDVFQLNRGGNDV